MGQRTPYHGPAKVVFLQCGRLAPPPEVFGGSIPSHRPIIMIKKPQSRPLQPFHRAVNRGVNTRVLAHLSRWSVEASQRGSVAFADQANACVSTSTIPLDPHERLGPAGATPGVGNLLHGRPGTPVWWRVPTRSRGCVRARRPRRGQAGAQKPPLHVPWRVQSRICAGGVVGRHPVRYRRLLYRLVGHCSRRLAEDRPSPAGGAAPGRFRGVLRMRYAG